MSFYAAISGSITYERPEDFNTVCRFLTENGWLEKNGLIDAAGGVQEETGVDRDKRSLNLGYCVVYRNLARYLAVLFQGGRGTVVWTSTDGCFDGGVVTDGEETLYALERWAEEHLGMTMPGFDESEDEDESNAAWLDAALDVEDAFHKHYANPEQHATQASDRGKVNEGYCYVLVRAYHTELTPCDEYEFAEEEREEAKRKLS